jgi:hypothetical protein
MAIPAGAATAPLKRRMVCLMTPLGMHATNLFPEQTGRGYTASRYLKALEPLRDDFTVFSGLTHPDVDGGHSAEFSFLTAAPDPGDSGFRNSVSFDQLAAERLGWETRFASLQLSTHGPRSISWTRGGVMIPPENSPARMFGKLFLDGSPRELERQRARLRSGLSIIDTVAGEAKRFQRSLGTKDREKLEEFFTSVRETERKLTKAEEWAQKPKPKVNVEPLVDVRDEADFIARTRLMYDLVHLALETDSTRFITLTLYSNDSRVAPIPGVTIGHHELSHHGKDPEKLRQLALLEEAEIKVLGEFLMKLKSTVDCGSSLLDATMVYFGSNLGNASSHDNKNLPILLAGGGFKHGQHLAFDPLRPPPLCNLYVQMLRQLGLETDQFGSSTGTSLPGFVA